MAANDQKTSARAQQLLRVLPWLVVYILVWALLSRNQGWGVGLLFITLATWLSYRLAIPVLRINPLQLPGFCVYFLRKLMAGGIDVALRTIRKQPAIRAGWVHYPLKSDSARVRLILSALIGLLPGTFAARMENRQLLIHALDTDTDWESGVAELESRLHNLLVYQGELPGEKAS